MAKIDIETLKFILQRNEPDIRKVNDIMHEVQMELKAEEEERANRPPAIKKQFSIILSDYDGELSNKDLTGWVVQIPEDDSVTSALGRIHRATHQFNSTPKGIRTPVATVGEACEVVTAKLFKEQSIWIKTKIPVKAVACPNTIPVNKSD